MAKAMKTIKESLNYPPQCAEYFTANQALFNRVVAFYFEVLQAHEGVLDLTTKEALTALETLTHATEKNPSPMLPLTEIAEGIPAMFRRAAINAALGSARSFSSSLKKWRTRKEKVQTKQGRKGAKKKAFRERPPVPPRRWNKSVPLYAGMWKERTGSSILLKVWTGTCWSWVKVRTLSRALPAGFEVGSPSLVRKGRLWWLHTPIEKTFTSPPKIAEQLTTAETRICAVDLNLDEHLAVCTVQTVEGTILATRFIGRGREIAGFRRAPVRTHCREPITDGHHRRERTGQCRPLAQDPHCRLPGRSSGERSHCPVRRGAGSCDTRLRAPGEPQA